MAIAKTPNETTTTESVRSRRLRSIAALGASIARWNGSLQGVGDRDEEGEEEDEDEKQEEEEMEGGEKGSRPCWIGDFNTFLVTDRSVNMLFYNV